MRENLNEVDLAFAVDTTGSMGSFIGTARQHMAAMLRSVAAAAGCPVDLRVAVVEYRDHPPQDTTFVTKVHPFEADLRRVQKVIDTLAPNGGGDGPEAVFDGVEATAGLAWRPHARRLAVLIGDAPPHGVGGGGDGFRQGCPCGLTSEKVTARLEGEGITLYALGLTHGVKDSFGRLAVWTGGEYFEPQQGGKAVEALQALLAAEFDGMDFDRRVLEACRRAEGWSIDGLSEELASGRHKVAGSLSRLGRRGLLATR